MTKELNDQSLQVVHLEEKVKDLTFVLKSKEDTLLSIEQEKNRIKEVIILLKKSNRNVFIYFIRLILIFLFLFLFRRMSC